MQVRKEIAILSIGIFIFQAVVPWFGAPKTVQAGSPSVVINEMLWMGSAVSSADEWVELRNMTDQPIDVSNWKLTKKSGTTEAAMILLPAGAVVPASGYYLVSNYASGVATTTLAVAPNFVHTDVSLVNSALQIKLYDATAVLIDTADDGAGNPLSGKFVSADKIYWSMERNPVPGDGSLAENWHAASRSVGFIDGAIEHGTPGSANSNALPIASAGPDMEGVAGETVNFDGSDSVDPEGSPLILTWMFGDGSSGNGATPSHAFAAAGEYSAVLTVSDGIDGVTDTVVVKISAAPAGVNPESTPPSTTPTAPKSPAPTTAQPAKSKTSCRGLQLSELFVNPAGVDDGEFIELANPTKKFIPLTGCTIWLNEKRRYVFPDDGISPGQYYALEKSVSKLSLTNTGGAVRLEDSDSQTLEVLDYPKASENESWGKIDATWGWSNQVTKGAKNLPPVDDDSPEVKTASAAVDEKTIETVNLADFQTLESGTIIKTQGTVTVAADVLASRTIWLQDDTGAGQALLAEDALRPMEGDVIELTATVRTYQGRKRLSVKTGDIKIITSGRGVEAKKVTVDQLSSDLADQLVLIEGVISSASGTKILVDDGSGEGEVYLKSSTGIVKPKMASGDRIMAVGVVTVGTAGIRILPRTLDDLRIERVLGAATTNGNVNTNVAAVSLPTGPKHQTMWYWVVVLAGVMLASVKPAVEAWKKRKTVDS